MGGMDLTYIPCILASILGVKGPLNAMSSKKVILSNQTKFAKVDIIR